VWDALRDVGALHTRLVRGFVLECAFDGQVRKLKFANGMLAAERIINVSELVDNPSTNEHRARRFGSSWYPAIGSLG